MTGKRKLAAGAGVVLLLGLVAFNVLAYRHAHAMLHYAEAGERTPSPEALDPRRRLAVALTGVRLPRPENFADPSAYGLAFDALLIDGPRGEQLELWVVEHEEERGTVVLLHGYGTSKASLLPQAKAYHELGFTCILVDFSGSGGSSGRATTLGYHEAGEVAAVASWYEQERGSGGPLVLHGFSMGAAAAVRAVARLGVAADALVLEGCFNRMLPAIRNRFRSMGWPSFPAAEALVFWSGVQFGFNPLDLNPQRDARRVRVPVLMLHGEHDPRATLDQARDVLGAFPGRASMVVFPGLGHEALLARQPGRWIEAVSNFLAGV